MIDTSQSKLLHLTQNKQAIVDNDDYDKLSKYKWHSHKSRNTFYAERYPNISMHSEIISCPKNMRIDHINGNGLDNRKSNLRIVTVRENAQNLYGSKPKTSKYPGVYWNKADKRWYARIRIQGKLHFLGSYSIEETAALRYKLACMEI